MIGLKVRNKLTVIAKMLNSAPDSVHTGVNYGSIFPDTDRVEN